MVNIMPDQRHRSIGEVLAEIQDEFPDITISKIRFLESQGLINPERTPSGYRKFFNHDVDRLRFILRSQKDAYLPLKVIRDRLDGYGDDSTPAQAVPATDLHPLSTPATPAPTPPPDRIPVWMQPRVEGTPPSPTVVARLGADGASFTAYELAAAAKIDLSLLTELEQFGLVTFTVIGGEKVYDEHAFVIAKAAGEFAAHGLEPRHLRMYKTAAEREAALYEQLVLPLVKQRNPQARVEALTRVRELAQTGDRLHRALLAGLLAPYLNDQ